ncbi:hypothetical protein [Sinimarinibacterium flocculans]
MENIPVDQSGAVSEAAVAFDLSAMLPACCELPPSPRQGQSID